MLIALANGWILILSMVSRLCDAESALDGTLVFASKPTTSLLFSLVNGFLQTTSLSLSIVNDLCEVAFNLDNRDGDRGVTLLLCDTDRDNRLALREPRRSGVSSSVCDFRLRG